ncbi:MAG: histidine kinase [Verrucomicrobiota bacterium]|nr:histidine kinase [Verrucomicrobiota bacterium]
MVNDLRKQPLLRWGLFLLFWTLTSVSFAMQFYWSSSRAGYPVSFAQALASSMLDWYLFGLLSIPMAALSRRFPLGKKDWETMGLVHLLASGLFSLAYVSLRTCLGLVQGALSGNEVLFSRLFVELLVKTFHLNIWIYWVILIVTHAMDYYRKFHDRELRAVELEKRLTQARLQALQMQLNPHFLFNTLHTISALMHKDVEAADRTLSRLSELLRLALDTTDEHEVTLEQELGFLQRYLEIEQTRFRERLRVEFKIAPDTLNAQVPNLLLQPIVENAIRHGIEPHARAGLIEISSMQENGRLKIAIRDNGGGLNGKMREGIGTSNTRKRLQQLYQSDQSFELRNRPEGGLEALLSLPFRLEPLLPKS